VNGPEAFRRPVENPRGVDGRSMAMSLGVHAGIILASVLAGVIGNSRRPPRLMGGGSSVSVEMVVLDSVSDPGRSRGNRIAESHGTDFPPDEEAVRYRKLWSPWSRRGDRVGFRNRGTQPAEVQTEHVRDPPNRGTARRGYIGVGASGEAGAGPRTRELRGTRLRRHPEELRHLHGPSETYRIHFT
jgi:hypothetical protein